MLAAGASWLKGRCFMHAYRLSVTHGSGISTPRRRGHSWRRERRLCRGTNDSGRRAQDSRHRWRAGTWGLVHPERLHANQSPALCLGSEAPRRKGSTWGLQIPKVSFDFQKVMARKAAMVEEFASYRREQLQDGRFELIRSKARFRDSHTLLLEDSSLVQADSILLATGSSVAPLPLPSLESIQPWTSNDVLDLKRLPASIIVLGGGPVALELAQFFLRFGVKTTLIQRSKQLLSGFDEDIASPLQQALEEEGMQIYTHTRLLSASRKGGMDCITFEHEGKTREVYAEAVLHGLGRVPNLGGLNLEKAGLNLQQGRLKIDAQMRSRVSHIYAAGDCAGPHEIVHIAIQQGETAAHNILHPKSPRTMDYRALVSVVFTDPQVAMVGLSEAEAKRSGRRVLCADYPSMITENRC